MSASNGLAISPDSNNVYVSARASSAISVFDYSAISTGFPLGRKLSPNGCLAENASLSCTDVRGLADAADVLMSPDGNTVYTAGRNSSFGGIGIFDRASNGALTQKALTAGCVNDTGNNDCADGNVLKPNSLAISADGKNLYAANYDPALAPGDPNGPNSSVTVFDVNPNGTITQKAGAAGCFNATGSSGCTAVPELLVPVKISIAPDGKGVYVATDLVYFEDAPDVAPLVAFDRNTSSGTLTYRGCFAAEGALGCVETAGLYRPVSVLATDEAVYVGSLNRNADPITFDGAAPGGISILTRDEADGSLSQKPFEGCLAPDPFDDCVELSTVGGPRAFAVSPDGDTLYAGGGLGVTIFDRNDGVPPESTINSGPTGETTATEASFTFSADKPNVFFECSIDSIPFQECTSPQDYNNLALGEHTFRVRATDAFEEVETTPADQTFTVVAPPTCETDASLCPPPTCATDVSLCPPPTCATDVSLCPKDTKVEATVIAAKVQKQKGKKIVVKVKVRAGEDLSLKATGSVKKGKRKAAFKPVNRKLKAGTTTTVKLKPAKAKAGRRIAAALRGGKRSKPKIFITLTDGAQNRLVKKPKVKIKGASKKRR